MFLSAIYSGMEGSSNQMQNFDDSVIINGVRSRKKISENTCCPVCSCTIRPSELQSHYLVELERLNKINCGSKRKLSSPSVQTGAIAGTSSDTPWEGDIPIVNGPGADVLKKVHQNRMKRLRAYARRSAQSPQMGECPVCTDRLPISKLQRHALRCLKRSGATMGSDDEIPDTSSEDCSIDVENDTPSGSFGATYTWGNEERVRSTALQTAEERASLGIPLRRASYDTALVVDGDEDIELYGMPQYSPSRIENDFQENEPQPPNDRLTEADNTIRQADTSSLTDVMTADGVGQDGAVKKSNGVVEASVETRIMALKVRIRELEQRLTAGHEVKCLICLGPYIAPAVSIQCWHVHCEMCWLDSLRAKKICPQCNAITTAQHLRRIYM